VYATRVSKKLTKAASFFALALLCSQGFAQKSGIDRIVIFGASLTDSGNAFVWLADPANSDCGTPQNVPPYDALDDLLIPDGPYAKGGHHFSNGATWVEGLARNLALAGNARRFNLPAQVGTYLSDFGSTSENTLIAIEIGGNDVRDALVIAQMGGDPEQHIKDALTSVANSIYQLYFSGARHFLLLNVPDIGKTPAVRALDYVLGAGGEVIKGAGKLSDGYNDGLAYTVGQLQAALGIDVTILDIHQALDNVIAAPDDYGFSNVSDACITPDQPPYKCEKPDEYIFWDGIHPTRALHAIVAQQAVAEVTAP